MVKLAANYKNIRKKIISSKSIVKLGKTKSEKKITTTKFFLQQKYFVSQKKRQPKVAHFLSVAACIIVYLLLFLQFTIKLLLRIVASDTRARMHERRGALMVRIQRCGCGESLSEVLNLKLKFFTLYYATWAIHEIKNKANRKQKSENKSFAAAHATRATIIESCRALLDFITQHMPAVLRWRKKLNKFA